MVQFRNLVNKEKIENWWSNERNQIAFSRGDKGFVAFTTEGDLREKLQTGLPAGTYCDVITGGVVDGKCSGKSVQVDKNGNAIVEILSDEPEGVLALHIQVSVTKNDKEKDNKDMIVLSKFFVDLQAKLRDTCGQLV